MKITVFTSNHPRHIYLINSLSSVTKKINVIQEIKTLFPGKKNDLYPKNKIFQKYFKNVADAENKIFKKNYIQSKNLNLLPLKMGDLKLLDIKKFKNFFNSDLFVVFGSSFIKGNLLKFLIKKKCINIHAGVSPYYSGNSCNFWAMYDNRPDLVGVTLQLLSKNLDQGDILHISKPKFNNNSYVYTMLSIKSGIDDLCKKIKNKKLYLNQIKQNTKENIRNTKRSDLTQKVLLNYLKKI